MVGQSRGRHGQPGSEFADVEAVRPRLDQQLVQTQPRPVAERREPVGGRFFCDRLGSLRRYNYITRDNVISMDPPAGSLRVSF